MQVDEEWVSIQNTIWTKEEIDEHLRTLYRHRPTKPSDHIAHGTMYTLYNLFNWFTGYKPVNTGVKAVEWRLILLESIAGLPGFIAAGSRHFRSLRSLRRDHGWITTLLEEAENERMHLFVCLKMFEASWLTRQFVLGAQVLMAPLLVGTYIVHPKIVHRFVGYLEETACHTYANVIRQVQTPGTPLHSAWADLPAPDTAIAYWRLPKDAKWVDALRCMFADECHHRDVNHTFADMPTDDPNPFVEEFKENALRAWRHDTQSATSVAADATAATQHPLAKPGKTATTQA